ncbi:helix-turn-helix domain-containing protein [Chryseobacterium paludis]|uniref:helix-turn-helix domain-containing protein n=1 Tax=Chryseobacterium paludis TaxID=2956784 RepID=UPI0021BE8629|nr:helix-turn-helix domain-containing protein [Chryseobacterium paludis]
MKICLQFQNSKTKKDLLVEDPLGGRGSPVKHLILHNKYKVNTMGDEDKVFITLSRTDLANMAGTANKTLACILHDFKEDHLILIKSRKIQLLHLKQLTQIANFY